MRLRLVVVALLLGAALADGAGQYLLAYYVLVVAVPMAAATSLLALGAILDGTASEPLDRAALALAVLALPLLLLTTTVRAPVAGGDAPPTVAATALVACLAVLILQVLLAGSARVAAIGVPAASRAE